jgi:predicted O-linked N-acetylglucosamine transferase (SPINDLY family)
LHEKIAALHLKACPDLAWIAPPCAAPRPRAGRIRVGFVSDYFHNHSIGRVTEGLVAQLDRERFSVYVLGFREPFDEISRAIAGAADQWSELPRELAGARAAVAEHALDVLVYPDVGMDPLTYFMTYARLAPVQCTTWGHPVTTGVPAIDYFLSTEYFEPEDGASHYSERLVKLRHAAFPGYYRRPEQVAPAAPAALGFDPARRTYFCPHSLFKFHPDFDAVLARILRRDPGGDLVLVYDEQGDIYRRPRLEARMKRAAPDVFDRITFVSRTGTREGYLQRLQACDVVLDTHPYCGGNTSLEAISMGALVVTLPSALNRGRHTYGFFRKMGFMHTVADNADAYVDLAVRIATDADYRAHLKRLQNERSGALYEDQGVVDQIGDFFEEAVRAVRTSPAV